MDIFLIIAGYDDVNYEPDIKVRESEIPCEY